VRISAHNLATVHVIAVDAYLSATEALHELRIDVCGCHLGYASMMMMMMMMMME